MDRAADRTGRPLRPWRVIGWIVAVGSSVVWFEYVLYMAALIAFTHLDNPDCAGSNTFCSPDGRSGLTGGATVVLVGNLAALVLLVVLAVLVFLRRRARR